ncbi:hypothetical protein [Aquipseudomonas alcaligenes]|uniref:Uncharacterized protein n=1 Tax=Aquipseudomonas alcaligenes TaxID=43263 RepID=A0A1N6X9W4_AQUAC|nr:hypothetical protein [Pseudomonas alcaligenes]SIQ99132.1 hypothetical protein SAMN05878282_11246 [Pseudomonas alcaligenes]
MSTKPTHYYRLSLAVAWAFMLLGLFCGALVMAGIPALVPYDFLVLAVGISGSFGLLLLGLLVVLFWGLLGQLLALAVERG